MLTKIISELNENNSSLYKLSVLKKYRTDKEFVRLIELTYNPKYNYGISKNKMLTELKNHNKKSSVYNINDILDFLECISKSKLRGLKPFGDLLEMLLQTSDETANIICDVLGHTLGSGVNVGQITKVFPELKFKPKYMRCSVFNKAKLNKLKFPVIAQVKMDGTYREIHVGETVTGCTRSGEPYSNPVLFEQMASFPRGYYFGEITIPGINRMKANGLVNSDNPPDEQEVFTMWDFLTDEEYNTADARPYSERFEGLSTLPVKPNIGIVESKVVNSPSELSQTIAKWVSEGQEGGVIKTLSLGFKDGTSPNQIKIKRCAECEMRITGFIPGSLGTKREGLIGAVCFENDEGTIKGRCSGFDDTLLKQFSLDPKAYIGKIVSVVYNDVTVSNGEHGLLHPRFVEVRDDKDETDTLEKCKAMLEMGF